MKGLIAIIAIKLVLVTTKCPTDPALIAPCVCFQNTSDVHCIGSITELQLSKLDPTFPWNVLYIHNTNLTIIRNTSLGNTKWDKIYVHNNSALRTLEADAFKSGPSITLWIANNTIIRNTDVYAVVKRAKNTERIFLEGNKINTMPSYMFDEESRVNYFRINNNIIREIRSNTFTGAKNLEVVLLDHNNITAIDPNGLDFTASNDSVRNVTVILDYNHLTKLNATTFNVTDSSIKVSISFDNNDIQNISKEVFELFLANGLNELSFDNNDFNCDCSFKWLLEASIKPRVFYVDCVNKRSILFYLNVEDLCSEEITTISTITDTKTSPYTTTTATTKFTPTSSTSTTPTSTTLTTTTPTSTTRTPTTPTSTTPSPIIPTTTTSIVTTDSPDTTTIEFTTPTPTTLNTQPIISTTTQKPLCCGENN